MAACGVAGPVRADAQEPDIEFHVPADTLDRAIIAFGEAAEISIALGDPAFGRIEGNAVSGRMDLASGLRALLDGTALTATMIDAATVRIDRAPTSSSQPSPPPPSATRDAPTDEVVVTASKRGISLNDYAGAVSVIDLDALSAPGPDRAGTGALLSQSAVLSMTQLGRGRNKLFIRGVADSSFNGQTQATVGEYFGEVRLNYDAPDPDLNLFDMAAAEVVEGPKGALFGAGALGGVIKLIPNVPDLAETEAGLRAGVSATAHGRASRDLAGYVNAPLVKDRAALRLAGYADKDGGYIDNIETREADVNRTRVGGLRAALRIATSNDWTIDFGVVGQNIDNADGQYSERGSPKLTRASRFAQPSDNDYRLAYATAVKAWGDLVLTTTTAYAAHEVTARFDATPGGTAEPIAFDSTRTIHLAMNETRVSRTLEDGYGWLAGVSILRNHEKSTRAFGPVRAQTTLPNVVNGLTEAAAFGEWTVELTPQIAASGGGRVIFSSAEGEAAVSAAGADRDYKDTNTSLLPYAALSWTPAPRFIAFATYDEGIRPGGLFVSNVDASQSVTRVTPDSISTWSIGMRYGEAGEAFRAQAAATYSTWSNIQADLVDVDGFPYTANVGGGRIANLSAEIRWRPIPALTASASFLINHGDLRRPAPGFERNKDNDLPNIAHLIGLVEIGYEASLWPGADLTIGGTARYVGESRLGVGVVLDIPQGDYVETAMEMRLALSRVKLSLSATNLADSSANRFSYGNPFSVEGRLQETPQRPRTIRIGLDASF